MTDILHKPMICTGCEREVPAESSFCPYCCGEDGRRGAFMRGGFIGGIFGLMAGGLAASLWSSVIGQDRVTWSMTLGAVLAGATLGMIWGVFHQRRK